LIEICTKIDWFVAREASIPPNLQKFIKKFVVKFLNYEQNSQNCDNLAIVKCL